MKKQIKKENDLPPLEDQVNFWNKWNQEYREKMPVVPADSERRADFVLEFMRQHSSDGPIIDIGCGTGCMSGDDIACP